MINDIGYLLKKKRKEKNMTLEQAGKLIGVSKVTYRDYELNNIKSARMDKLMAIAKFLEMSPEEIFNDDASFERITAKEFEKEVISLLNKTSNLTKSERDLLIQTLSVICSDKN